MIDANVLKALTDVDPEVACLVSKGVAYVHSLKFVLELPEDVVKKTKWPGKPLPHITTWRQQVPKSTGTLKTTAMPSSAPNGTSCMQLMALTTSDSRFVQHGYYRFFCDQLDEPMFKILQYTPPPGEISAVGIYNGEQWVGALGAYLGLPETPK